jgi:hypothetical protein
MTFYIHRSIRNHGRDCDDTALATDPQALDEIRHSEALDGVRHSEALDGVRHSEALYGVRHSEALDGVRHSEALDGKRHETTRLHLTKSQNNTTMTLGRIR